MKIPKPKFEPGQECVLDRCGNVCYISHVRLCGVNDRLGELNWQYELVENRHGKLEPIHGLKLESEIKTYADWKADEIKKHLDAALGLGWAHPGLTQEQKNAVIEECASRLDDAPPKCNENASCRSLHAELLRSMKSR